MSFVAPLRLVDDVLQDARYGVRQLRRSPSFALVAVLVLALGIGGNAALFSLIDAALLKRLPVFEPERLVSVVTTTPKSWATNVPAPLFDELRREPRSFSGVCAFWVQRTLVHRHGSDEVVLAQLVSPDYYATLGISPAVGRLIGGAEDDVVVLAYRYWQRHFGGDPAVMGTSLIVDGSPRTVIGVTRRGFFGTDRAVSPDVTMPLRGARGLQNLWVVARRKPQATLDQARSEVTLAWQRASETIRPGLSRWSASDREEFLSQRADLIPASTAAGGMGFRAHLDVLRILVVLSAIVLLVGCANISTLLLARSATRRAEIGTRVALGASRTRLVRQAIVEAGLLSCVGAMLGGVFAFWAHRLLVTYLIGDEVPVGAEFALDMRLFAFMACLSAVTAILSGLVPGLRACRQDVREIMKAGHSLGGGRFRLGFGRALIVGQVAACVLLLVVGVLLARTLGNLRTLEPGFAHERLLVMTVGGRAADRTTLVVPAFYEDLLGNIRAAPGVVAASLAAAPVFGAGWNKAVWVRGQRGDKSHAVGFNVVAPGFFATSGMRIVAGRDFSAADRPGTPLVVVVNEAFARRFCPERQPLDCRFGDRGADSAARYQVVGIVNDARHADLRAAPEPTVYEALLQEDRATTVVLHVRSSGDPRLLSAVLAGRLRSAAGKQPVYDARTVTSLVNESLRHDRMMATLSGFFAVTAVGLTWIGLFAVVAMGIGQRTREIGIRLALGARQASVLRVVVGEAVALTFVGCAAGVALAIATTRVLERVLFEMSPTDPATIGAAVVLVLGGTGCATYLPARRASALNPVSALRHE